mmetsp:Transcript_24631/g.43754  ORF Transcript_24631/g.43754 Transcript_24631/m.43754 type:complete len:256 (+) Transcript_24631:244-1011(+)
MWALLVRLVIVCTQPSHLILEFFLLFLELGPLQPGALDPHFLGNLHLVLFHEPVHEVLGENRVVQVIHTELDATNPVQQRLGRRRLRRPILAIGAGEHRLLRVRLERQVVVLLEQLHDVFAGTLQTAGLKETQQRLDEMHHEQLVDLRSQPPRQLVAALQHRLPHPKNQARLRQAPFEALEADMLAQGFAFERQHLLAELQQEEQRVIVGVVVESNLPPVGREQGRDRAESCDHVDPPSVQKRRKDLIRQSVVLE